MSAAKPSRFTILANPTRFLELSGRLQPWLYALALIALAVGLTLGFRAPPDYQQGATVQIMFIHVPFAWLSMMIWTVMSVSALGTLVWRHPLADVAVKAAAPIGAVFTALALITGFVNIPIIKFSVDWWNTLHQSASVIRVDGPAMPPVFLIPLLVSAAGFTLLFFALHLTAMRTEVLRRRVAALSRLAARRAEA